VASIIELVASYLNNPTVQLSSLELFGHTLLITGGLFRLWAMNHLGRFFTFTLSIRERHQLITDGPYAIVRHPSYTGLHAIILGAGTIAFNGNFTKPIVGRDGLGGDVIRLCLGAVPCLAFFRGLAMARMETEEGMMRGAFGERWEEYARVTRFKLIPGLW